MARNVRAADPARCGTVTGKTTVFEMTAFDKEETSPKSYGTAVILCGIFGVVGIHHFYLEDYLHGAVDLGLLILGLYLIYGVGSPVGLLFILVDILHTIVIFYLLIVEKWRDGQGRPIRLS